MGSGGQSERALRTWQAVKGAVFGRRVKAEILGHILEALRIDAVLSADGVLALLPALARDVGPDFLPALPTIITHFVTLFQAGALGPPTAAISGPAALTAASQQPVARVRFSCSCPGAPFLFMNVPVLFLNVTRSHTVERVLSTWRPPHVPTQRAGYLLGCCGRAP